MNRHGVQVYIKGDDVNSLCKGKYIFCVSPGRSGTHFLSNIFGLVPGVCSVHEPEHQFPKYNKLKPQNWNLKQRNLNDSFSERKLLKTAQINDMMNSSNANVYVETNPMFSTLWHDVILNESADKDFKVIMLRRNAVDLIKSIVDLGWYGDRNGDEWMLSAYSINSLFYPPWLETDASTLDLVIGHLINVELCANKIVDMCGALGHKVIEVRSESLFSDIEIARNLLIECGLEIDDKLAQKIFSLRLNKPAARKKYCNIPVKSCEKGLDRYLSACEKAGLKVPTLL